ncbi:MAG: ABC transporter permease [Clostridia bacterium]
MEVKITKRKVKKASMLGVFTSVIAAIMALVVSALVMLIIGINPIYAYWHLFYGSFGNINNIANTLVKTTPILIAGIGLSISFRSNLTSIGAEGQMIMGGIFATTVGLYIAGIPSIIGIPLVILAGFVGGGLLGAVSGFLKAKFGTSEIINTIMLNYIAINFLSYLLDNPLRESGSFYPQSAGLAKSLWLPIIMPGSRLHAGFILALLLIVGYYLLMFRLPLGYKIRAVGYNPKAAEYAGIKVGRSIIIAMLLSGGLAGIAGSVEVFSIHHRLFNDFSAGYGFDALAVALLGQLHPIGVFTSALFFGALRVGSNAMQRAVQVPISIVYVIQGLIILFILTDKLLQNYIIKITEKSKKIKEGEDYRCQFLKESPYKES